MHVKASGTISRVSQIWSKVSGTWTRNKAALIKTNPVTIFGNSYPWAISYLLKPNLPSGTYTVNGTLSIYGNSYGVLSDGSRYYAAPGSYVLRTTVTLGSWPSWYAYYYAGGNAYCAYDGQLITSYTGHNHYAGNTTHTVTTGVITTLSAPPAPGASLTFMTDQSGQTSTLVEVETAMWKVG
jgi:hypothetical protein